MPETATDDRKHELLEDYRRLNKVYGERTDLSKEDITHMTRLGIKANGKTRPIKITLRTQEKRKDLLTKNQNLKLLENDESTNIYVSTDRTKKQREEDKELREELKRQKITNPNLVIRNGKIVPFRPRAQEYTTWANALE